MKTRILYSSLLSLVVVASAVVSIGGVEVQAQDTDIRWLCKESGIDYGTKSECISGCSNSVDPTCVGLDRTTAPPKGSDFVGPPAPAQSSPVGQSPQQVKSPNTDTVLMNPLGPGLTTLPKFIISVLDFVAYLGSMVVVLMLIYVGFLFVMAQGKPGELETARNTLFWTVVGGLVLLGSKAIAIGIQATIAAISVGK